MSTLPMSGAVAERNEHLSALAEAIAVNPNDPSLVGRMQDLLAATNRSPDALRLLFDWYTRSELADQLKGALLGVILLSVRADAHLCDPRIFGVNPDDPRYKAMGSSLKHHLDQAFEVMSLLQRFQADQVTVRTAPKFIIAIPKSGSSLVGICLGNMVKLANGGTLDNDAFAWRGYPAWWDLGVAQDWDLRPEIGADPLFVRYPGGIYKGHIPPTDKNLAVLGLYPRSRYVITVRDPRDQLVAAFCSKLRWRRDHAPQDHRPPGEAEVHEEIGKLISGGALLESLHFAGKWLAVRDRDRSLVVTYEQVVSDPLAVLEGMSSLYELGHSRETLRRIHEYASPYTDRAGGYDRSGADPAIYPMGWTGRAGVHESYLSPRNRREFDKVFNAFAQAGPWAEPIRELYPDL